MTDVYVLKLENGNYYVGKTDRGEERLKEHVKGQGAEWTKLHKPKKIHAYYRNAGGSGEKKIFNQMVKKYGAKKVRGAHFTKRKASPAELRKIEQSVGLTKKITRKKSPAKKTTTRRTTTRRPTTTRKTTTRKSPAKKTTTRRTTTRRPTTTRKTTTRKSPAKKTTTRRTTTRRPITTRKTTTRKSPAKKTTSRQKSSRTSGRRTPYYKRY